MEESSAKLYRERLEAFIGDLRREWSDTSAPWILGQIDVQPAWPWAKVVREGTSEAAEALERVSLVETVGLPTDGVHYTAEGIKQLGVRFADLWLEKKGLVPTDLTSGRLEIRWIEGGRLVVSGSGPDPILEARLVSLDGRLGPWTAIHDDMVFTRSIGRTTRAPGMVILQVRRRSGTWQFVRVAWP